MRWDYMYGGGQWLEKEDPPFQLGKADPSYIGRDSRGNLILKTWCVWESNNTMPPIMRKVCGSLTYELKNIFRPDRLFAIEFNLKALVASDGGATVRIGNGELEAVFNFTPTTVILNGIDLRIHPGRFKTFTLFQACLERAELYIGTEKRFNRPILKPSTFNGISIEVSGNAEVVLRYLFFCVDYVPCRLATVTSKSTCQVRRFVFAQKMGEELVMHTVEEDQFGNLVEIGNTGLSIYKPQVKLFKAESGEVMAVFRRNKSSAPLEIVGGYIETFSGYNKKAMPWTKVASLNKAEITEIPWDTAHTYEEFDAIEEKTESMLGAMINDDTDPKRDGSITLNFEVDCGIKDNPLLPDEPAGDYDFYIDLFWTIPDDRADPKNPFVDLDLWAVSAEEVDGQYVYNPDSILDYTTSAKIGTNVVQIDDWLKMSLVKDNRSNHRTTEDIEKAWSAYRETITVKGNYGRVLTVGVANYAALENYAKAENVLYLRERHGVKIEMVVWDKKNKERKGRLVIEPEWLYREGANKGCVLPIFDIIVDENRDIKVEERPHDGVIPLPIYSDEFRNNLDDKLGH
ncbi:hypothetical protein DFP93_101249 [Aneurinibacillus soli]|uniref:Uncharacterized protein n=1 Tax=Aneurinibacillus soli TaxID=1500254 RepID=A0A0U5BB96_9BACL|nr:hypothetical protein [Aneurinibacillus soli]PYE64223.1 hypothetical protein DFP93_101249 [Aneurinibacillus soli]BAU28172.1 hypothetical protein CB4_02346 [Aneurinibacillus soli]